MPGHDHRHVVFRPDLVVRAYSQRAPAASSRSVSRTGGSTPPCGVTVWYQIVHHN